jgi:hypothetical protein
LKTERIKIEFHHVSVNRPLVKFWVDGKSYANLQIISNEPIIIECDVTAGFHVIEIQHYGKNYNTDGNRSFELKQFFINGIDMKYEILKFKQFPDLPPWETWHTEYNPVVWDNNLHLGHNGKIIYNNFSTPSIDWFKSNFVKTHQPHGMQSSKEVLDMAKDFLKRKHNGKLI